MKTAAGVHKLSHNLCTKPHGLESQYDTDIGKSTWMGIADRPDCYSPQRLTAGSSDVVSSSRLPAESRCGNGLDIGIEPHMCAATFGMDLLEQS